MQPIPAHVGVPALAPLELAPLLVAAVLYGVRTSHLRGTSRAVPGWRQACFFGGIALLVLALTSPLSHIADELFVAHMAEHLIIGDLASLLLVLGLTGPLLQPLLHRRRLGRIRVLFHPVPAFGLWAVNLYLWHVPALHEAAVQSSVVHAVQHASFLTFGMGIWMAILGPLPKPAWFGNAAALGYVLLIRLTGSVLGNVLVFGGSAFYDVYAPGQASWGISAQADQNAAGALMMIEASILTIGVLCWLFLKAAREQEERQTLLDLAGRRGVALDERRAARAVAAGRGAELRRRVEASEPG